MGRKVKFLLPLFAVVLLQQSNAVTNSPVPSTNPHIALTNSPQILRPTLSGTVAAQSEKRDNKILPFTTALFGSFFGALGAYWVGRFKEKRDEENRRHTALLATQFAFFSQWHVIESLRITLLEPVKEHEHRHMRFGKYVRADAELAPLKDLTFLIDSDDANLLQEIQLTQMAYLQTAKVLDRYIAEHAEFEKRHPPVNLNPETKTSMIEISKGEYNQLKIIADMLYKEAYQALPRFNEQIRNIHAFVKRNFKNRKSIPGISQLDDINKAHEKAG
jgi:hypothetical protein